MLTILMLEPEKQNKKQVLNEKLHNASECE